MQTATHGDYKDLPIRFLPPEKSTSALLEFPRRARRLLACLLDTPSELKAIHNHAQKTASESNNQISYLNALLAVAGDYLKIAKIPAKEFFELDHPEGLTLQASVIGPIDIFSDEVIISSNRAGSANLHLVYGNENQLTCAGVFGALLAFKKLSGIKQAEKKLVKKIFKYIDFLSKPSLHRDETETSVIKEHSSNPFSKFQLISISSCRGKIEVSAGKPSQRVRLETSGFVIPKDQPIVYTLKLLSPDGEFVILTVSKHARKSDNSDHRFCYVSEIGLRDGNRSAMVCSYSRLVGKNLYQQLVRLYSSYCEQLASQATEEK